MTAIQSVTRIMVDLETLGTKPGSVITDISAVAFSDKGDPQLNESNCIGASFCNLVQPESCTKFGLKTDINTVLWWMKQGEVARALLCMSEQGATLDAALSDFSNWIQRARRGPNGEKLPLEIWGDGASFDPVLLESAYEAVGQTVPWGHRDVRCYRTMKNLFPHIKPVQIGDEHVALDDTKSQAIHLLQIERQIFPWAFRKMSD